jgi:lactate permease
MGRMSWTPPASPLGPTGLSALVAALPLVALFVLLASGKVKGWIAALAGFLAALATALLAWRMPALLALAAGLHGVLYALFPILWILVAALWIYHLSVESGQFEIVKATLADLTPDRRLQALLVAFAFGAFLEGTAGYGVPVAITSAMLIGLGFPPVTAALLCLVANSSPVAFAAAGVPVAVAAEVAGLDVLAVSRFVGRLLPPLSLIVPAWLCVMLCGWRRSLEVLPAILAAGVTLAVTQFLVATLLGPWTAGVLSGLAAMAALALLVRFWKPRRAWDFGGATAAAPPAGPAGARVPFPRALRAWSPWLLASAFVLAWGTGLPRKLGAPAFLSSPGTAIFLAGCLSVPLLPGLGFRTAAGSFGRTLWSMRWTILTVCLVLATAYLMNAAGMSAALGRELAATGPLFPVFSALIGWVGVLLTGSDTSSNALFCGLQRTTADALGVEPALAAAANTAGGVTGKMVSPQNLSVATAAAGLAGQEGMLFRRAIGHSLAQALLIGLLTLAFARS